MRFFQPKFLALATLLQCTVLACKYNVRDVGFVNLESVPYRLFGLIHDGVAKQTAEALTHLATASLLDSNVEFEKIDSRTQPDHEALRYSRGETASGLPELILVAPDGRFLGIPIGGSPETPSSAIWTALENVVASPFREQLLKDVVQTFALVVLVEGSNQVENTRAKVASEAAARDLAGVMDRFPKPVRLAPQVAVLSREQAAKERVLLWSLGIDNELQEEPVVAVLYGRARRVGPLLQGKTITQQEMARMLGVLGQDCECDLDRAWMQGPLVPARWGPDLQAEVLKEVGFDAENPMIKTEISRILARGPSSGARRVALPGIDTVSFLGYKETSLDDAVIETAQADNEAPEASQAVSPEIELSAAETTATAVLAPEPQATEAGAEPSSFPLIGFVVSGFVLLTLGGGMIVLFTRRPM